MKKREMLVANFMLLCLVALAAFSALSTSVNGGVASLFNAYLGSSNDSYTAIAAQSDKACSDRGAIQLNTAGDPHLDKLAEYQQRCGSFVTDRLMIFVGFSASEAAADTQSTQLAAKLKLFKQNNISPIVVVEPYLDDSAMSFKSYLAGQYDTGMDAFFAKLKAKGVTEDMMGTWVPFPEPNTPSWNNANTEPRDFALCVNKYLSLLKRYYPNVHGSILLSATTYEPTDKEWANGDYISLLPYLQEIDKKLVSSFGIQGFPWVSPANTQRREIFRASEFLQTDLVIAAAQELRTRDIWINTGSFASKYTNNPKLESSVVLNQRKAVLDGVLSEATRIKSLQQNEYRVSINLFSEDKSKLAEATDWSYFQNPESIDLFKDFLRAANKAQIPVSLFDIKH